MRDIPTRLCGFLASEDGPTAVEYAVMLALILVAAITAISTFGSGLQGSLSTTFSKINAATSQGQGG